MMSVAAVPLLTVLCGQPSSARADAMFRRSPKVCFPVNSLVMVHFGTQSSAPRCSHSLHTCDQQNCVQVMQEFAEKLIGALQDAIEADLSDMEERQVSS